MKLLSIDFGTSSLKAAILDEAGRLVDSRRVDYSYEIDGQAIQIDPEVIYAAFVRACGDFGADAMGQIDGLALCVFSPCLIAMDRDGRALYPGILHMDRRSYDQSRRAMELAGGDRFLNINGNLPFAGGISCTSILWIQEHYPELAASVWKYGHLNTFLLRRLTGRFLIEPTNASFTGLYETLTGGGWSQELCQALKIPMEQLPDLVPSLSLAGPLTAQGARGTGLRQGIPVIVGSNDSSSASYGAGAVENGDILNISGSSEIMNITVTHPVPNPRYYIRTSVEPGKWLYLAITTGGFAVEWFRRLFCQDMSPEAYYDTYLQYAMEQGRAGEVRFEPHLAGNRHSLSPQTGAFLGLTLDTRREDLLRALLLGSFQPLRQMLHIVGEQLPLKKTIRWTGGMCSEPLMRLKQQEFPGFSFLHKAECSTMGNYLQAKQVLGF